MDAGKRTISEIFNGTKVLEVPFFQRAYVWRESNWERFLEDVEYVCSSKMPYFMGSLILKQQMTNMGSLVGDVRLVIDGQQRLTTISVFLKVLSLKTNATKKFEKRFMLDEDVGGGPVLHHNQHDLPVYEKIMNLATLEELNGDDRISECYRYFVENVDPEKLDFGTILDKILFVGIDLDQDDDEQQIFDTINSLGVVLSTAELLKNYFFSRKDIKAYQDNWFEVFEKDDEARKYWDTDITAGRTKRTFIDLFFYSFLLIKLQESKYDVSAEDKIKLSKFDRLFESYKYFIKYKCNDDRMGILKEIKEYAVSFKKAFDKGVIWRELPSEPGIERINAIIFTFDTTTLIPYVLYIEKNVADVAERNKLYDVLEAYIARRIITRATTKNYNRLFTERLFINQVFSREAFIEYMQESDDVNNYIPANNRVRKAFHESILVNSYAAGILYLIESRIRDRNKHSTGLLGIERYSLEHMMPKKWQNNWDMPEDVERRNWMLLTLGNLTIITQSLNASIRDADWKTKKHGTASRGGLLKYADGIETLSGYLQRDVWNEEGIFERAEWLYQKAVDIWKIEGLPEPIDEIPEKTPMDLDNTIPEDDGSVMVEQNTVAYRDDTSGGIKATRRKYWTYALGFIKEAFGPRGPYSNVTTSKEYWMNGYIGIRGFHLACEAKLDRAAVLLVLEHYERERNKSAFKYLFDRKEAIEEAFGTEVDWWAFEKGKSSYVNICCPEAVGMSKTDSWEKMAKFHAEWSKKFYDVLVPYLREWNEKQGL